MCVVTLMQAFARFCTWSLQHSTKKNVTPDVFELLYVVGPAVYNLCHDANADL